MSTSPRNAALGIVFITVVFGTTALLSAQRGSGCSPARHEGQQPAATTTSASTRLLQLVDANGAFIAPVPDFVDSVGLVAHAVFDLEGHVAVVQAGAYGFRGRAADSVVYESPDCTGTGHIQMTEIPVFPLTAVTGVAGAQTLHVADQRAEFSLTIRSTRVYNVSECRPQGGNTQNNLHPVVGTLDLATVGEPPYRVVFEPQIPCGASCSGPPPQ